MENKPEEKKSNKRILLILLALLLLGGNGTFAWLWSQEKNRANTVVVEKQEVIVERDNVKNDLLSLQKEYGTLQTNDKGLQTELEAKRVEIADLIEQAEKHKGRQEVGVSVGELYGYELMQSDHFKTVTTIIPVPLHPKRQKKRGYNQSDCFAEGLSKSMHIEVDYKTLYRALESETQTKKSRFNRWQNVETIFQLRDLKTLQGKHVLLVDDVITTGATFEACAQTLLQVPDIKVSIAAMAYASH